MRELSLNITARARQYIEDVLRRHPEGSLPALMFGRSKTYSKEGDLLDEKSWHFSIAVYPREQAEQIDRDISSHGYTALYQVGDLVLCIPQATIVTEQVEGATLDVDGDHVCII